MEDIEEFFDILRYNIDTDGIPDPGASLDFDLPLFGPETGQDLESQTPDSSFSSTNNPCTVESDLSSCQPSTIGPFGSNNDRVVPAPQTTCGFAEPLAPLPEGTQKPRYRKGTSIYQCTKCPQIFTNRKKYGVHTSKSHKLAIFKCDFCETTVSRHDNLKPHLRGCKGKERTRLGCNPPPSQSPAVAIAPRPEKRQRVNISSILNTPPRPLPSVNPPVDVTTSQVPLAPAVNCPAPSRPPPQNQLQFPVGDGNGPGIVNSFHPDAATTHRNNSRQVEPVPDNPYKTIYSLRTKVQVLEERLEALAAIAKTRFECEGWARYHQLSNEYRALQEMMSRSELSSANYTFA